MPAAAPDLNTDLTGLLAGHHQGAAGIWLHLQSERCALLDMPRCEFYQSNVNTQIPSDSRGDQLCRVEPTVETIESCELRFADGDVGCKSKVFPGRMQPFGSPLPDRKKSEGWFMRSSFAFSTMTSKLFGLAT